MNPAQPARAAARTLGLHGDAAAAATARLALTITATGNAVLLAVLVLLAALVDRQSDILANRSEASGGFDPSVFPPYNNAIWVLANGAAALAAVVLITLIALRISLRRQPNR